MSDEPETPDPLAEFDQLLRAVVDVARLMRAYHLALLNQGFGPAEALALTIAYQQTVMQGSSG